MLSRRLNRKHNNNDNNDDNDADDGVVLVLTMLVMTMLVILLWRTAGRRTRRGAGWAKRTVPISGTSTGVHTPAGSAETSRCYSHPLCCGTWH